MVYGGPIGILIHTVLWAFRRRRLYRVAGHSMGPALQPGDLVFVRHRLPARSLRPGDIVVARHPWHAKLVIVKRVAGVDAEGRVALIGDNPHRSSDSRQFGSLQASQIIGRATCKIAATRNPLRVDKRVKRDCLERTGG